MRQKHEIFKIIRQKRLLQEFPDLALEYPDITDPHQYRRIEREILEHIMDTTINKNSHRCVADRKRALRKLPYEPCFLCGLLFCDDKDPLHFIATGCPSCGHVHVPQHIHQSAKHEQIMQRGQEKINQKGFAWWGKLFLLSLTVAFCKLLLALMPSSGSGLSGLGLVLGSGSLR